MARGGFRPGTGGYQPGAGRPKKSVAVTPPLYVIGSEPGPNQTPLEYMLAVMNDPSAPVMRRDRMAMAAAPYLHPKAAEERGKKELALEQAQAAGAGTDWGDDLTPMASVH